MSSPPQVAPAMVVAPPNQVQGVQQIIVQQPQVIMATDWSRDLNTCF